MRELHARVGNHGRGRERLHTGEHRRNTLAPLFERGALRCSGVVDALDHRSCALRDGLVLRARRGNLQRAAHVGRRTVSQSLERGEAGVLVFCLQGDVEELRRIGHARDCLERCLRVERVARDAAQRADVMYAPERCGSHRFVRRALRNGRQLFLIREAAEGQCGVAVRIRRRRRDGDEAIGQLATKLLVGFGRRELHQIGHRVDARDSRASYPNVLIRSRELDERTLLLRIVDHQFRDRRCPHCRVGVLPFGIRLETVEERHGEL